MHYTYVIKSKASGKLYVGSTENLVSRLKNHNDGKVISTKSYAPWSVVYYEAHLTDRLARSAELFYKTGQGRRQLKKKLGLNVLTERRGARVDDWDSLENC